MPQAMLQKSALIEQLRNKAVEQEMLSSPLRMARRRSPLHRGEDKAFRRKKVSVARS
jgi:hypothetical protein